MRIILHIDFDSFFANVEQQLHPEFRDKPLGVTAAHSRSCIIAASKEAKRYGVKTGSRSFDAYRLCPKIILTPANFHLYYEISKKFLTICQRYSPFIEVFSIDELFMDVSQTAPLFGDVYCLIKKLKVDIQREIGAYITVSVGISHSKLLAKLASGLKKPDGISLIRPEDVEEIYRHIGLTDICGIGFRIAKRLRMLGVRNPFDIRKLTATQLAAEFGPYEAAFLHNIAWADDATPIVSFGNSQSVKSVGRNYCLAKNEYDQRIILQHIFALCEEIGKKLRKLHKKARSVGLSLRGTTSQHGHKTGITYMDSGVDLFRICSSLYHQWHWGTMPHDGMVRQIAVWASFVTDTATTPLSLFQKEQKQEKVVQMIDTINEKFGNNTVYSGFLLKAAKLETVPNGFLADKVHRTELTSLYVTLD